MSTLTIGQVMEALETASPEATVYFDFCGVVPTVVDSWRGIYAEAAIGHENCQIAPSVTEILLKLREAIDGRKYFGYKGGEFTFDRDTPLHVDNWGECFDTDLTRVEDRGHCVILHTEYVAD